jgi:hypothetical protein
MTPLEWNDYKQIRKILDLCEETQEWNGPIDFTAIAESVTPYLRILKAEIGDRLILEKIREEGIDT